MHLEREREDLIQKAETAASQLTQSMGDLRTEQERIFEERSIYKQKIELTERQLEEEREASTGLKLQLETLADEHQALRGQLA